MTEVSKIKLFKRSASLYCLVILLFLLLYSCADKKNNIPFPFDETEFSPPERTEFKNAHTCNIDWDNLSSRYLFVNNKLVVRDSCEIITPALHEKPKPQKSQSFLGKNRNTLGSLESVSIGDSSTFKIKLKINRLKLKHVAAETPIIKPYAMPVMKDDARNNIQYLGINQNLPSNDVRSIIKDKYGRIWVGTDNGLAVFEGEFVKIYQTEHGLPHVKVRKLLEDSKGNIWICTYGGGVCYFDGKSFVNILKSDSQSFSVVNDIVEDSKNRIWIATANDGVIICDLAKNSCYRLGNEQKFSDCVAINLDKSAKIWVSTHMDGMCLIDENCLDMDADSISVTHYKLNDPNSKLDNCTNCYNWIACMAEDDQSRMWLGSVGGGMGYVENSKIKYYNIKQGLAFDNISSLYVDSEKNIWIGTFGAGISKFDGTTITTYSTIEGMTSNFAMCSMENDDGSIWVGTSTGGINIIGKTAATYFSSENSIVDHYVSGIAEDNSGNVFLGMMGGGMAYFDGIDFSFFSQPQSGIINTYVNSLLFSSQSKLFIGSSDAGLIVYDGNEFKCNFCNYFNKNNYLSSNDVTYVVENHDNKIWAATFGGGINIYDPAKDDDKAYIHLTSNEGLSSDFVTCLFMDSKDRMWAGTAGEGVNIISDNSVTVVKSENGLADNHINCIIEDNDNNIWIGTVNAGVCIFDGTGFTNYSTKQGLSDNAVNQLGLDSAGNIWAGTGKGLTKFVKARNDYVLLNLGKSDGLKDVNFQLSGNSLFFNRKSKIVPSGQMWFGAGQTLTIMELPNPDTIAPKIFVTDIEINNTRYNWHKNSELEIDFSNLFGDVNLSKDFSNIENHKNNTLIPPSEITWNENNNSTPYYLPLDLKLEHNYNSIIFHFNGLKLSQQNELKYRYILEGFDSKWSSIGNDPKAEYKNLPPGEYTFRVRSRGKNFIWSDEAVFIFTIYPPFWKTWWAYSLYVILFILMMYLIVKLNSVRLTKQKKKLEKTVSERTEEIVSQKNEIQSQASELKSKNDELIELNKFKEGLTGMLVHDLKNPLNSIINQTKETDVLESGKQMLNMVMNILDIQKFEHSKMQLMSRNFSLYACAGEAISQVRLLFERKSIKIINKIDQNLFSFGDFDVINRVFVNILTNAIKYSANNSKIEIESNELDGFIKISIADSGRGIPTDKIDLVFEKFTHIEPVRSGSLKATGLGLAFCKIAVEAHGGKIGVESEYGKGSVFWFMVPAGKNYETDAILDHNLCDDFIKENYLTEDDEAFLKTYKESLIKLSVYEFSDIMQILSLVETKNQNIEFWKTELENSVKSCNEEKYLQLIKLNWQ